MKHIGTWIWILAAAVLLAGCGAAEVPSASDKAPVTELVTNAVTTQSATVTTTAVSPSQGAVQTQVTETLPPRTDPTAPATTTVSAAVTRPTGEAEIDFSAFE